MKIIKVIIAVFAVGILIFIGLSLYKKLVPPQPSPTPPNSFVKEINAKISNLGSKPSTAFCVESYRAIKLDIDGYALAGKIDKLWKENLLKNLEFTYTPLFVKQTYYVFNGTSWESAKIAVISIELRRLMSSIYLDNKLDLKQIQSVLNEYNKVNSFLNKAHAFARDVSVSSFKDQFDTSSATTLVVESKKLSKEKGYVRNCKRFNVELASISKMMYDKHLNFLKSKVTFCTGKFNTLESYLTYNEIIYKPIFQEFETFKDTAFSYYSVSITDSQQDISSLITLISNDGWSARAYFSK